MADKSWDDILTTAGEKFNILPEGRYQAVIKAAEAKTGKPKDGRPGNEMVACTITVSEGPHAGKSVKTVYVSQPGAGTLPEKWDGAVNMFMRHLKGVGITFDILKTHKPTMAQIAQVMQGKSVTVEVKHEDWRGETQAAHQGPLLAPTSGAVEVTSFPPVIANTVVNAGSSAPASGFTTDPGF